MGRGRKKHPGGRPPRDPSGATVPWSLRLSPAQLERAQRAAEAAGMSPRDWAARALAAASETSDVPRFETIEDAIRYVREVPDDAFADLVRLLAPVVLARQNLPAVIAALTPTAARAAVLAAIAAHAAR